MEVAAARPARRVTVLLIVVSLLLVAALGAGGWLWMQVSEASDEESGRADAVRTARQFAVNFTTISHETVGRDIQRVEKLASGDFGQEYRNATDQLRKVVKQSEVDSTGQVLEAGIVDFDGDDARVLVVADSELRNVEVKQQEARHYRLQLDLAREGDAWRVVDVMFVQ